MPDMSEMHTYGIWRCEATSPVTLATLRRLLLAGRKRSNFNFTSNAQYLVEFTVNGVGIVRIDARGLVCGPAPVMLSLQHLQNASPSRSIKFSRD